MATLPTLPVSYRLGDKAGLLESQQIEYKRSTTSRKRIIQTLCGFLNTNGGYMICGIDDDLNVLGVSNKYADQISRDIDDIIRGNTIINISAGEPAHHSELGVSIIPIENTPTKKVVAIRAVARHSGSVYSLISGERVYRLNASNHIIRGAATEFERLNRRVCDLTVEIAKVCKKNHILTSKLESHTLVLGALYDRILAEKAAAEKHYSAQSGYCRYFTGLLCGLFTS